MRAFLNVGISCVLVLSCVWCLLRNGTDHYADDAERDSRE